MAYAAVNSLLQTLDLENARLRTEDSDQCKILCEKLKNIQSFLEDSVRKHGDFEMLKDLERRIENVVKGAEDIIESHLYFLKCLGKGKRVRRKDLQMFRTGLIRVIEEIESINDEVSRINDNGNNIGHLRSGRYLLQRTTWHASNAEKAIVGLDDDLEKIKDQLTGSTTRLEIVTILGMGGIGKSTLARRIYDDPLIKYHFYVCAWITISQGYQVRNMLIDLIRAVAPQTDGIYEENENSEQHQSVLRDGIKNQTDQMLAEHLYRTLRRRRYLIVMDDVWSNEAWDDVKRSFPDDRIGSRIIVTSRLKEVANYINSASEPHQMQFLSLNEGWDLLKMKVFSKHECPTELEEVGKKIAEKCGGLPLAIVVVAGHLSKMRKEKEAWLSVADNVGSLVNRNQVQFLNIIALSYNHLPHHLKACFLYLGAFPENTVIPVWRLTALWIAEGFLKRELVKGLEEVAEECVKDLIDRSLVLVERRINDRVISCRVHDILRDFCLREAEKTNFWHVMKRYDLPFPEGTQYHRRLCAHLDVFPYVTSEYSNPQVRTLLVSNRFNFLSESVLARMGFKLLRVLDIISYYFSDFPVQVLKLVQLRYLGISTSGDIPTAMFKQESKYGKWCFTISSKSEFHVSISNLVNLQILIVNWGSREIHSLPFDIRKMSQLRHIRLNGAIVDFDEFFLKDTNVAKISNVLLNLQTLSTVSSTNFNKESVVVVPNLRKLGVLVSKRNDEQQPTEFLNHLSSLQCLEMLKLMFGFTDVKSLSISKWNVFPPKLKALTLCESHLPWEEMAIIGTIPNLEVLKLKDSAFAGPVWQTIDGGFLRLKFLLVQTNDLKLWRTSRQHFPSLQHLVLKHCHELKEIPRGIGEIPTLQMIELYSCGRSAVFSAKKIQEEQPDDIEVHIKLLEV